MVAWWQSLDLGLPVGRLRDWRAIGSRPDTITDLLVSSSSSDHSQSFSDVVRKFADKVSIQVSSSSSDKLKFL
ncbi:hypothetical protein AVEN_110283-1 [Araneus ventricosus]|uniref:Uncharacterized protein n=1 Tax=Araneus ventricosus TaxID=182803 RepID=A0A4Y2DS16_ARAVE|nr:hypothetical protein AVEN_110283-1 [Araneus ventricosus]